MNEYEDLYREDKSLSSKLVRIAFWILVVTACACIVSFGLR